MHAYRYGQEDYKQCAQKGYTHHLTEQCIFISRVWLGKIYIKHKFYISLGCYPWVSVVYFN